jgi:hypothetical protein
MRPPSNSLAVVTGATAGIGRVFAERLARQGHALLLIARDGERLTDIATRLGEEHRVPATALAADLSREEAIDRVVECLASAPNVGVLVNNAGFGTTGHLAEADPDVQAAMVKVHTLAPMRLARAVLPAMVARGTGWIINVSSIAGFAISPGNVNYNATKAYLTRFSLALDAELAGTRVVVQALCPGFTHTEFHERAGMNMRMVPEWLWMSAGEVVDTSIAAAERGRPVIVVPGFRYRVLARLLRVLPVSVMRWGSRWLKRGR